jgi:L-malate glycosyltransferase
MTGVGRPTRVLMLGTVNHPHVEHLSLAMHERGFELLVGGGTEPSLPESVLGAADVRLSAAPAMPRRTLAGAVAHVRWIRRLLRDFQPDVVHAHWMPGFAFFAAAAGASPLIAMAWGSDVYRASRRQELVNRFAVRRAAIAMTDSVALLSRLEELGAPPDRTFLLNWGVDLERFAPADTGRAAIRAELGLGPGPAILSPRSLMPVYNIPMIVAAFASVGTAVPDAQLLLKHMGIASGELGPIPHADRVHIVGHVPYERMADWYRASDVCVSIASSDSSPRSVWEAMACGVPMVVSDLPWVRELIEPEVHALVVPIETGAVAAAVERLLTDPELAQRLSEQGRALVERHRDRRAEMDRLAAAYERLAAA